MGDVEIPTGDVTGVMDSIKDYQSWPSEVWAFISILVMMIIAYFVWNNMSDKLKIGVVGVLLVIVIAGFMA